MSINQVDKSIRKDLLKGESENGARLVPDKHDMRLWAGLHPDPH